MHTIQGEKYQWYLPDADRETVFSIASKYNLSIPLAQVLVARGLVGSAEIDSFLLCEKEREVHDPTHLKDGCKAVERIEKAMRDKEKILIFGDYDVDGITSTSVMMRCLFPLEARINFYLPHRVKDGYGISSKIVQKASASGYRLIITVDNGITAIEAARQAKECGIDLIITDHHRPHGMLPDAFAIVNPNQDDCPYPFKHLAGVGVAFKLMSLLYHRRGQPLPEKVYELLLLGTVADVVPMVGENRYWTRYGLRHINMVQSHALRVLAQNAAFSKPKMSSLDIGFSVAPQINALGRLEDPRDGVKFLLGSDVAEVERIGAVLFELNKVRKDIERSIFDDVVQQVESGVIDLEKKRVIVACSNTWPPGVIGLVASRLVGEYARPVILLHRTKSGILKGSCRSIPAFNMFEALEACSEFLEQFGGHSHAAGLSLREDMLDKLCHGLETIAQSSLTDEDLVSKLVCDASAKLPDLGKKFIADMQYMEPFGHKNPQPMFVIHDVSLSQPPRLLKDLHVKCSLVADGVVRHAIFFNRPELFSILEGLENRSFSIAGQVSENHWNGRTSVELIGTDIAYPKE